MNLSSAKSIIDLGLWLQETEGIVGDGSPRKIIAHVLHSFWPFLWIHKHLFIRAKPACRYIVTCIKITLVIRHYKFTVMGWISNSYANFYLIMYFKFRLNFICKLPCLIAYKLLYQHLTISRIILSVWGDIFIAVTNLFFQYEVPTFSNLSDLSCCIVATN